MRHLLLYICSALCLWVSCTSRPGISSPTDSRAVSERVRLYPDYRDVTIPPNMAPLNLYVKNAGESFVVSLEGGGERLVASADADSPLQFDLQAWRKLLQANRGGRISVTVYALREDGWVKLTPYGILVAREPIDPYLSYRLIEPLYESYRQMGLYQRDLRTFGERAIYENNRTDQPADNHCINCHSFRQHSARQMLFHVRAAHGGTVFINGSKAQKIDMRTDSLLSAPVYPAWHPLHPWVAFSVNRTGQAFHLSDPDKVEVVDFASDLVLYDTGTRRISPITHQTDTELETFPSWSPDGRRLYYTCAHVPQLSGASDARKRQLLTTLYRKVYYNVMSRSFDPQSRSFGPPVVEYDCAAKRLSASVPRISPDGRYLLFTLADFGQFHIWHSSADLYVKDLRTGHTIPLTEANAPHRADSYHGWSSNGRWIVFASRRDDGTYSRVYIAYFDRTGHAHKAFLLPQEDPLQNIFRLKSYNVPELTRDALAITPEQLQKCVYADAKAVRATYASPH